MDTVVLDSYALMAVLQDETGADQIQDHLERARNGGCRILMTSTSLGEAIGTVELHTDLWNAQKALAAVEQLPIEIRVVDETLALTAACLRTIYELPGVDSLVVALAILEEGGVLTNDSRFEAMAEVIMLEQVPGRPSTG